MGADRNGKRRGALRAARQGRGCPPAEMRSDAVPCGRPDRGGGAPAGVGSGAGALRAARGGLGWARHRRDGLWWVLAVAAGICAGRIEGPGAAQHSEHAHQLIPNTTARGTTKAAGAVRYRRGSAGTGCCAAVGVRGVARRGFVRAQSVNRGRRDGAGGCSRRRGGVFVRARSTNRRGRGGRVFAASRRGLRTGQANEPGKARRHHRVFTASQRSSRTGQVNAPGKAGRYRRVFAASQRSFRAGQVNEPVARQRQQARREVGRRRRRATPTTPPEPTHG